ncbi:MAG: DUF362 domain-containing protein [Dehalococcoidia bacterium]
MHRLTRRDFLRLGAGAAVALGVSPVLTGCEGEEATPKPSATPEPSARVAAIRGNDLYTMAREALEAVGGAQKIVNPGETVFIKPNMVTLPFVPFIGNRFVVGECTKPEIVIAVAEECLGAGAAEVIIGDGSQMPSFDWELATTLDGSTNLAEEAERLSSKYEGKVTLACLDVDSPEWVEVPTSISLGKVAISSLVTRADRIISIPVVKTHKWAQLTLSLKNFIGITPLERYGWKGEESMWARVLLHKNDFTPEAIAQLYLDIVDAVKPDLAIIDASIGVEGDGPEAIEGMGTTVDMKDRLGSWLLLASTDLVAADATAARIVNHDVAYVDRILAMGYEQGLGEVREDSIEIIGERLDNLRVDWKPAKLAISDFLEGQRYNPAGAPAHVAGHRMAH